MSEQNPSGVIDLDFDDARSRMSELLSLVEDGQFVYLLRHGKRVAVIMPADIGENYEKIEDDYWARRAGEVDTTNTIPRDQVASAENS